jgi:hypothetical protein
MKPALLVLSLTTLIINALFASQLLAGISLPPVTMLCLIASIAGTVCATTAVWILSFLIVKKLSTRKNFPEK